MLRVFNLCKAAIGAGPFDEPPTCQPVVTSTRGNPELGEDVNAEPTQTDSEKQTTSNVAVETGATTIEAVQVIWGKKGRWLVIAGLCLIMIVYEIDNSTVYIYRNYATSEFQELSKLATLSTAGTIIFAVAKPPVAKLSNVIGRGGTYFIAILFYILACIIMASAKSFNAYAAGSIFYSIGQSATNLMNDIVIADLTTARYRAFGIALSFWPFLITPWTAAFIVDSVTAPNGIGWRWGIGLLAIIMPFCASFIVTTLLFYQSKAKKEGLAPRATISSYEFCSQIDLGGVVLFSGGLALVLIPMTLAATAPSAWKTPWIIILIVLGAALLIVLPFYEYYLAKHPVVPPHYFANRTVVLCCFLIALDSLGFSATHTYIYAWVTVARGLGARDATFFTYTNGVTQCLIGIVIGLLMARTRRYKWVCVLGSIVRLVGYGVMLRLRGSDNSIAEIFVVQLIQGIGSGMVGSTLLIPAQAVVSHVEMPQMTALVVCFSFVGGSVGACISGGIYTGTIRSELLRYLGGGATAEAVSALANSITGVVPGWDTPERIAVNLAFTQVMKYMTYAAVGSSAIALIGSLFMPNFELPDKNNLVE
ncbi:MFS general substrate transporter [Annulohypoxylon maeteangense]|uniref:MFS general substrate transporter n=1 Tax=Annulohypoxylon maeteangense TaxID=1927788 RepID=UPI002008DD41|nr:MFS general substrate transporter [Annulohypoxylon maeteangense]KAI0886432.1 MFS general substrate transporter [Annulohypoxylon maeteangense]